MLFLVDIMVTMETMAILTQVKDQMITTQRAMLAKMKMGVKEKPVRTTMVQEVVVRKMATPVTTHNKTQLKILTSSSYKTLVGLSMITFPKDYSHQVY